MPWCAPAPDVSLTPASEPKERILRGFTSNLLSFMKNQKFASDDVYPPGARPRDSQTFDALAQVLIVLMGAAFLFFALFLVPAEFDAFIDELPGWCVAGVAAAVAFIVAMGLLERLKD
jgi:hypothetical protein